MSIPFYDSGIASGLLSGILFGYALEAAGFASPRKLTAQFSLRDFAVFKVMFTAVLVAATGLWLLRATGMMAPNAVFIPTLFFWAILAGGILIGAGFALGGYCPGTAAVGIGSGRIDAVVFAVGMVIGTSGFAWIYDPLKDFYLAGKGPNAQTLSQLFGLPDWAIILGLLILALIGFRVGTVMENGHGGALSAEEVCAPDDEMDEITLERASRQG